MVAVSKLKQKGFHDTVIHGKVKATPSKASRLEKMHK